MVWRMRDRDAINATQARITEMFGTSAASVKAEKRHFTFRYRSPMHFLDVFRNYYGPTLKAFAADRAALTSGMRRLSALDVQRTVRWRVLESRRRDEVRALIARLVLEQ